MNEITGHEAVNSRKARQAPVIYGVTMRHGTQRGCTSLREAKRIRSAERRDGWRSEIRDLRTGQTIR